MSPRKVVWQEGMLLRPQHFQQHDRYVEHQLCARVHSLLRHAWGFAELQLDRPCLALGKLLVNRASGLLPDGTLFTIGAGDAPLALDIPPHTQDATVYLCLALASAEQVDTRREEQQELRVRYVATDLEVADANAGESNSGMISCAHLDLRLQLGDTPQDAGLVRLPVCRVDSVSADGRVHLDEQYIPSLLDVHAHVGLLALLKEALGLLTQRGDCLAERVRACAAPGTAEMGDFLLLQMINRCEPQLRHCLEQPSLHPEQLYRELLAVFGELATFTGEQRRPQLQIGYRHADLAASFGPLMDGLRLALSMVLEQHAIELPLQTRQYGIQVAPLFDHRLLGSASFVLAASAQGDTSMLRQRLPSQLKIGAVERIRQLVNLHLPGIRLQPLPVAPRQLPYHAGKSYFVLQLSDDDRAQLESSGGFAFHLAGDCPGLELKFWAIRE
ncbi:type VI secretion system baseplate subunit TssK [Pseudomonas sp. UL073]|uniref:Type VI secretion system baseplate subunit TssK n=1 Tax=Zestomonas insulae TaxID=2809017 RepID=A0ABS2IJY7_9GAMM|nr:type VI secretion system baseplate subunit TssK [Pseudomonas insulae]MBM7063372.1 type VI secretion system baseplate subunit TssK [Pseudomonas insulae]